jgi:hypothetical protein
MLQFIVDILLVILGVLGSKIIFSSLYKPKSSFVNVFSYVIGGLIAFWFYATWAATGLDPIQLSICKIFENAPICMEKRAKNAAPENSIPFKPYAGLDETAKKSAELPKNQSLPQNLSKQSVYARCAGSYELEKCIQQEKILSEQSSAQARERAAILDRDRSASMIIVNSPRVSTMLDIERDKNMSIVNAEIEASK